MGRVLKYAKLLVVTARMHILGAIIVAVVFFMVRAKLRLGWVRLALLGLGIAADIFLSARFIVNRIL